MLRCSLSRLAKRTPGYVFWRQNTLVELEHAKRNYLLSERPVPIAEVARRMVRVKARYEETGDFHEKNLLRGEYKYFTGKPCDIRAARAPDMIGFLQCAAFFGFWDASQVERVMAELQLKLSELTPNELVCLFGCLPGVRKQQSELYRKVAHRLAAVVPELTLEECVAVCRACDDTMPASLLRGLFRAIAAEMELLAPGQAVDILDVASVAPPAVQRAASDLVDALRAKAVAGCEELGCMDIAVLYTTLQAMQDCDAATEERLIGRFVAASGQDGCARSVAMMLTAAATASLSTSLRLAQQLEDRVVFLATDFTPDELLPVFRTYLSCFVAISALLETQTAGRGRSSSSAKPASSLVAEIHEAQQRQSALRHVLEQLHDQLVDLMEGAAALVSPEQQMGLLEVYATAVADLDACNSAPPSSSPSSSASSSGLALRRLLPQTQRVMHLLADKVVARVRQTPTPELVRLLELGNDMGPALMPDAVVAAAVQELATREWSLASDDAAQVLGVLEGLTDLRAEHQRRINMALAPKLRGFL